MAPPAKGGWETERVESIIHIGVFKRLLPITADPIPGTPLRGSEGMIKFHDYGVRLKTALFVGFCNFSLKFETKLVTSRLI